MILIFAFIGAVAGWILSNRDGDPALQAAVIGAVGGVVGGIGFGVVIRLLGMFAGALGAIAGAVALVWLYRRWRER